MSFFLAIDAGGTKTDYVLADDTHELARVRTGTIKRLRTNADTATRNLDDALAQLSTQSNVAMQSVTRTCVGTAGERVPLVTDWLRAALTARVGGELVLLGDVEIAVDAAFPGQAGVLVLSGTGSNVAGRTQDGILLSAGGWGPALADQGSGHRIGQEGLRAAFLAIDEHRTSPLMPAILKFWQLPSIDLLIEFANSVPAPDFSKLAEVVVACATRGDEIALSVLRQQGEELAYLAKLVMRRLQHAANDDGWVPPVAFAGSIMEKVPLVRNALVDSIRLEFPHVRVIDGVVDPVLGALWRARNPLH